MERSGKGGGWGVVRWRNHNLAFPETAALLSEVGSSFRVNATARSLV